MAVTVKNDTRVDLNNGDDVIGYLQALYATAWDPFNLHQRVNITNRFGIPSDVAPYNTGILIFGRAELPICTVLALTESGSYTALSLPKVNIGFRS